jgi:hypothetical protein
MIIKKLIADQNLLRVKLVDGLFSVPEAKEVLIDLVSSKINFHNLKIISTEERFGIRDTKSELRLAELKELRLNLLDLFEDLKESEKNIRINGIIRFEVVE